MFLHLYLWSAEGVFLISPDVLLQVGQPEQVQHLVQLGVGEALHPVRIRVKTNPGVPCINSRQSSHLYNCIGMSLASACWFLRAVTGVVCLVSAAWGGRPDCCCADPDAEV